MQSSQTRVNYELKTSNRTLFNLGGFCAIPHCDDISNFTKSVSLRSLAGRVLLSTPSLPESSLAASPGQVASSTHSMPPPAPIYLPETLCGRGRPIPSEEGKENGRQFQTVPSLA